MTVERWSVRRCTDCGEVWPLRKTMCEFCGRWLHDVIEVVHSIPARTSDPDTSKLAALRKEPRFGSQRGRILEFIRHASPISVTSRQIEEATGIPGAWKRVSELKQGGHIIEAGTEWDSATNTDVTTYIAAGTRAEARGALF